MKIEISGDFTTLKINNVEIVSGLAPQSYPHTVTIKTYDNTPILEVTHIDGIFIGSGEKYED